MHMVVTLTDANHVASIAKCGVKRRRAAFQSVVLVHVQRGSKSRSAGRRMSKVAVTNAWSLPAMGPQCDLPHEHSIPSWTAKESMAMLGLWTRRSNALTLCVRLGQAWFASNKLCSCKIVDSNSEATLSCFFPG